MGMARLSVVVVFALVGCDEEASSSAGSDCFGGETMGCTCLDGTPSVSRCNGGGFGVCECTPGNEALPAGSGGTALMEGTAGGNVMQGTGGTVTMDGEPNSVLVVVSPEDAAACTGAGQPPMANETTEILQIRVSDAVPGGYTSGGSEYSCFWVEIDMPEKHHIIGWQGAIGGDRAIHHQQVSLAPKPGYLTKQGGLCGLPTIEYTWTGGNDTEWSPQLAGYPLGGPENGGKAIFLWQVHFEGATTYSGGFNVVITKDLRKYDAGNWEQGDVSGISIPPGRQTHVASCDEQATMEKIKHPIYAFGAMMHAHLIIESVKSEQFRDGKLFRVIGEQQADPYYGLTDQSFKPQSPCIEILPGDRITTTCNYNNKGTTTVVGGERTDQEMCASFFQYFPRLPNNSDNFCGTIDSSGGFN